MLMDELFSNVQLLAQLLHQLVVREALLIVLVQLQTLPYLAGHRKREGRKERSEKKCERHKEKDEKRMCDLCIISRGDRKSVV